MAAQNCRKRKLGQIDELAERLQAARRTQDLIRQEHSKYDRDGDGGDGGDCDGDGGGDDMAMMVKLQMLSNGPRAW